MPIFGSYNSNDDDAGRLGYHPQTNAQGPNIQTRTQDLLLI